MTKKTLREVIDTYKLHPEFLGIDVEDVNQKGALDGTLLHIAARTGNLENVKVLVEAGADVNARGDLLNTPLHEAAMSGQLASVELLVSLGADVKAKNEFGQTALEVAELGTKMDVCGFLRALSVKKRTR